MFGSREIKTVVLGALICVGYAVQSLPERMAEVETEVGVVPGKPCLKERTVLFATS